MITVMPNTTNLKVWADSLFRDFPEENIPVLMGEHSWKEWGAALSGLSTFQSVSAPSPQGYNDWSSWAVDVYNAMIGA